MKKNVIFYFILILIYALFFIYSEHIKERYVNPTWYKATVLRDFTSLEVLSGTEIRALRTGEEVVVQKCDEKRCFVAYYPYHLLDYVQYGFVQKEDLFKP